MNNLNETQGCDMEPKHTEGEPQKEIPNWCRALRMIFVLCTVYAFVYRILVKTDRWLWNDSL